MAKTALLGTDGNPTLPIFWRHFEVVDRVAATSTQQRLTVDSAQVTQARRKRWTDATTPAATPLPQSVYPPL